jgi:DNA-binding NarL/FixJ family response regulator
VSQTTLSLYLADDHRLFRAGLRLMLERMRDIRIAGEADNGLDALEGIRATRPDLVLLDISMPGLNGIEVTRRVKEQLPDVRIIILSMHSDRHFVLESLRAGADGYLLKDAGYEELVRVVREVHQGRRAVSAGIAGVLVDEVLNPGGNGESGPWRQLTARERQVLQRLAEGTGTREIAESLNLSVKTVETHRKQLMDKLDLHSVAELTKYAIREGLTQL